MACRFVVREAEALDLGPDYAKQLVFGVEWVAATRRLEFDGGAVAVTCARPNLEVTATDQVVGYRRVRRWRIGGLESSGPWPDD